MNDITLHVTIYIQYSRWTTPIYYMSNLEHAVSLIMQSILYESLILSQTFLSHETIDQA